LNTPLPIAYAITITQISWAYILLLPMQLWHKLGWGTPLAVELAAYIILGFSAIGTEIENPFGGEVNDLPLSDFCTQIEHDIDIVVSHAPPKAPQFLQVADNMPLYPVFMASYRDWMGRSEEDIREGLKMKLASKEGEMPTTKESSVVSKQV
jgi:ion channel-forming bestrophin family protein